MKNIPAYDLLPPYCYAQHPVDRVPIKIVRGESTYEVVLLADATVRQMNETLGVTPQQVKAMLAGSMFGWHVPAADPRHHNGTEP